MIPAEPNKLRSPLVQHQPKHSLYNTIQCAKYLTPVISFAVTAIYTLPYLLTITDLSTKHPIIGLTAGIPICLCIARIGLVLYARHVIEMFNSTEEIKDLAHHLGIDNDQELPQWSMRKKAIMMFGALLFTLPLGLTKINLASSSISLIFAVKILYLLCYSFIDAAPHVTHLQLHAEAKNCFKRLPAQKKLWIITLMLGHALNDSADIWNANGILLLWVGLGLSAEFFLSSVEAVAHHEPEFPHLNLTSSIKFLGLFFGATGMGALNWYNTFGEDLEYSDTKLAFIIAQMLNICFITTEAWHHEAESHDHDHSDHYHSQADIENNITHPEDSSGNQRTLENQGQPKALYFPHFYYIFSNSDDETIPTEEKLHLVGN